MAITQIARSETCQSQCRACHDEFLRVPPRNSRGPSMYEMEGPRAPHGHASEPMTRLPVRYPAATGYRAPLERAGLPALPRSPGLPEDWPAVGGERISTATAASRTRCSASKYKILLAVHRTCQAYPPEPADACILSTAQCTGPSAVPTSCGTRRGPVGKFGQIAQNLTEPGAHQREMAFAGQQMCPCVRYMAC